ncbi:TlpA family protein disulfide reductase [Streptomyces sp. NPDC000229]|uniref:TlpA family protein disulfide reductase n=1 Tax=Streptomyces sp. NPDC000229 TaxID=3154247 RepID=UPI003331F1CE
MSTLISIVALILASASCALSWAVARRVKKLVDPLVEEGRFSSRGRPDVVPAGTTLPEMGVMTDVHGDAVSFPSGDGEPWILTFQSVGCSGCKEQLPGYRKYLKTLGMNRDRVFSVITGDASGVALYRSELDEVSHIVHADAALEQFTQDLGVAVWPTYLVVSGDGRVLHSGYSSARLAESGLRLGAGV